MNAVAARLARGYRRVAARLARGYRRIAAAVRQAWAGWREARFAARPLVLVAAVLVGVVLASQLLHVGEPSSSPPGTGTVRVGVRDGDSVPDYARRTRQELTTMADGPDGQLQVYALVALSGYRRPTDVATLLSDAPGVLPISAFARVPLPGRQTELVRLSAAQLPDDLVSAMRVVAVRKSREAATSAARASAQADPAQQRVFASIAMVEQEEADAYKTQCSCVYALVVRATPAALVAFGQRKGVRMVDAAPEVNDPARTVFVAPLPEQVDRVSPPRDDGVGAPPTPSLSPSPVSSPSPSPSPGG